MTELASRPMACPTQIFRAEKGNVQRRATKERSLLSRVGVPEHKSEFLTDAYRPDEDFWNS